MTTVVSRSKAGALVFLSLRLFSSTWNEEWSLEVPTVRTNGTRSASFVKPEARLRNDFLNIFSGEDTAEDTDRNAVATEDFEPGISGKDASERYSFSVYSSALPSVYSSTASLLPEIIHPSTYVKHDSSLRLKRLPNAEPRYEGYANGCRAGE